MNDGWAIYEPQMSEGWDVFKDGYIVFVGAGEQEEAEAIVRQHEASEYILVAKDGYMEKISL